MNKLLRGLARTVFWSYERGSWAYDVMVAAIVLFVLFTPRGWFHDQPRSAEVGAPGVRLLVENADEKTRIYRVDASALAPNKRTQKATPELERETHDILGRNVEELKDRTFRIVQIDPARASDGSVLYYTVTIHL